MPSVQEYAKGIVVQELKDKLGTELGIGRLYFQPFNTIELDSVYLYDQSNEKVLMADRISASIDLFQLLKKKVVITSAWLTDIDVYLSKPTSDAQLNIQFIIDAFKSDDTKPKSKIEVKVNSVNITNGEFHYNVVDKPYKKHVLDPNHIHVQSLNTKIALKSLTSDSLNIQIKKLNLKEKSGLEVSNLICRILTQKRKASIRGFKLEMPSSYLELNKCEIDLSPTSDTAKVMDYAELDCIIAPSYFGPKDIAALVPELGRFNDKILLKAHIKGLIDNFSISNLSLSYGEKMELISNLEVKDLRNRDKMYILGSIDDFTIPALDVEKLINNFSNKRVQLPQQLKNLGTISFQGDISGYLKQLTAFGSFETSLGIIKTDILFGLNPKPGISSSVEGKVYTAGFDLGRLLQNKDLNKTAFNISVNLEKPKFGKLRGDAKGTIANFDYKGYNYEDITLDANYDGLRVDGHVNIDDPNGALDINGMFDFSKKDEPELNFRAKITNLQLDELNLAKTMKDSYLSFSVNANFTGKDIDNASGYLSIDSIDFIREDKTFMMNRFLIEASGTMSERKLKITSDLINGDITGSYSFATITKNVQQTLYPYLSALIKQPKKRKPNDKDNDLSFSFHINNTEQLSAILKLPVTVIMPASISGFYHSIEDKFRIEVSTPEIKAAGKNIKSGYVLIENPNNSFNPAIPYDTIHAQIKALVVGKNNSINDIAINSSISNNLVNTNLSLSNNSKQKAKGNFSISTLFSREDQSPLSVDIDILPSELLLNNASWKMERSHIRIQDGMYGVDNFMVYNEDGSQEIKINGKYTNKNSNEILKAELKNIDLEYVFQTLAINVLKFGGKATGRLFVSSIEEKPYANTRLEVADFKFNGTDLGKLKLFSELDEETNKVILDGSIVSKENKETGVNGFIDPVKQALSINFDADSIDIGFLETYAQSMFHSVSGRGSGNVHLFGNFSDVTVEGKAYIQNGNVGIRFTNTNYSFTDTIFLKQDLIYFNDVTFSDIQNNKAKLSGKVVHDYFHDFMYHVDLAGNNFLVYDVPEKVNPLFSGRIFATGKGSIGGDERQVDIDLSMRTEDKTAVRMNFMDDVVNEYSFISYKQNQKNDSIPKPQNNLPDPVQKESGMNINMNFYIDATPDAVVELVMDPVGGDVIKGSGNGAMQFVWDSKSSPRIYGTYNINRGSYNFTFQRLLEKKFNILDGSSVQFRGDPFEATLDVSAVYKVTASLRDLDKNLAMSIGQTNIPVNCILNLTGQLRHPNVNLDIKFPAADPEVERQVKSLINTEDMINRQVAFLLLLSKFYTPNYAETDSKTSDFASLASATLSNQLTKIVNSIDDRWQLGTNIRYSDSEFTRTEVELILSSQLLDDRLLINGNFGYRDDPDIQRDALISDVDLEYLINNSGSWRVKAYNHYNEKYYYTEQASSTQGVGIMYKKDFDNLKDLFPRRRRRALIRPDSIDIIIPDSAKKGSPLSSFIKLKR